MVVTLALDCSSPFFLMCLISLHLWSLHYSHPFPVSASSHRIPMAICCQKVSGGWKGSSDGKLLLKLTIFPKSAFPFLKCALCSCNFFNFKIDLDNIRFVFYKIHIGLNHFPWPFAFYCLNCTSTFFCSLLLLPFLFLLLLLS